MATLVETAAALAVAAVPASPDACLAQAQELAFARDRLISAITARVERVHRTGEARTHGHASTRTWLQNACGTSRVSASHLVTIGTQLARLPTVRARFAEGTLSEGQVNAICTAIKDLADEQAPIAEQILTDLADHATPEDVAKAGRYLRDVLDPDGQHKDDDADHDKRFLRVRPTGSGGMQGEFRLPKEAAARLKTWLDTYAKPKADNDDRPLRVRNADALTMLLETKITTELLVLVNAESLPTDHPTNQDADPTNQGADQGAEPDPADDTTDRVTRHAGEWPSDPRTRPGTPDEDQARRQGQAREPEQEPKRSRLRWKVPGLLLSTGQLLSPSDIDRLARTSTLIRLVMNADGQVLDMGRAVRLATKPQRKAVYARYSTCWIDGCPLPATMCQIDHADNWTDGGLTNLNLLGPACQFHNRDRYRHPHRYQRHPQGKDRWAFTYTPRPQHHPPQPRRQRPP
ncbi:HNH endonuclease signature motif containing protein [Planotetraspora kaengkrachanensis]|uniref:HNH endonuclease signature motif containing protein n=1 Tax=Planotetraspora kaengkrachanensis TaxID=575193 RepID=UPI0031E63E20